MYKLYTNGCSYTKGTELALDGQMNLTWPNLLANHLRYELVDGSLCGASNDTIYNTTLEYILSNPIPPDKVVIQFTDNDKELSHKILNRMYSLQNIFYEHAIEDYNFLVYGSIDEEYITYRHLNKDHIMFDVNHKLSNSGILLDPENGYMADAHKEIFNWLITKSFWDSDLREKETFIEYVY